MRDAGETLDLVILDPRNLLKPLSRGAGARAYKDINLNGLKLLNAGGHLFTFSCSGAIDPDLFRRLRRSR